MSSIGTAIILALLIVGSLPSSGFAQDTTGPDIIIRLRLSGDDAALPTIRSCLVRELSQMPDIKVETVPTDGVRFILDVVAVQKTDENVSASFVVAQTFPMEQFRPRIKKGEDKTAFLTSINYYTLIRMHEIVPSGSYANLCRSIAADLAAKVLSKEYTERDD